MEVTNEMPRNMYLIELNSTDPFFNLAADEYLLKSTRDEFLTLGINDPCAVIGKHQSAHRETDTRFVCMHRIPVIRRISGGGTVFHDHGNLNFSFILNSAEGRQVDFRKYSEPVIGFLKSAGINAGFGGKNDLRVDGLKISGNAEHVFRDRVLHHGTLLFNSDLDLLRGSIRKDTEKYTTRAVASNPSSVINITALRRDPAGQIDSVHEFKKLMMSWMGGYYSHSETRELTDSEIAAISSLADSKYRTWEWNYAYGPEYSLSGRLLFRGSDVNFVLSVRNGVITMCSFEGSSQLASLGEKLAGQRHMVEDVNEIIKNENLDVLGFDTFSLF